MVRLRTAVLVGALGVALLPSVVGAQTYTRTDVIVYHDNIAKWVLGQVASSTNTNTGLVEYAIDYDTATALPLRAYAFGKLQRTLTYNANGNVATVKDGNNNVTTFSSWKRGIPQSTLFADGSAQSASVNDHGWITSTNDELNSKTCYEHDAMGRVSSITYPSETTPDTCDTSAWNPAQISFQQVNIYEHGLAPGHWRRSNYQGNKHVNTYYDALWRPVLEEALDYNDVNGTLSQVVKRYDHEGRIIFQSYPRRWVDRLTESQGVHTIYDALGRVTSVSQDSENGLLTTLTQYQAGFQTRVTDPKGAVTITKYMAFDQPTYELPVEVKHPESAVTKIERDVFGNPVAIVRSSP